MLYTLNLHNINVNYISIRLEKKNGKELEVGLPDGANKNIQDTCFSSQSFLTVLRPCGL